MRTLNVYVRNHERPLVLQAERIALQPRGEREDYVFGDPTGKHLVVSSEHFVAAVIGPEVDA